MSTFLELKDRIADDINRDNLANQIGVGINRAIRFYQKRKFWFQEKTDTFNLVVGQEAYTLGSGSVPSDIADIITLTLQRTANDDYPITRTTFDMLRQLNDTQGTSRGTPNFWTLYANAFYFSPVPSNTDTINLYYYQTYSDLSQDADTNDFTTNAEDLIESRARWWINLRILKDFEAAQADKLEEREALAEIYQQDASWKASRRRTPYAF